MNILHWNALDAAARANALRRPTQAVEKEVTSIVSRIVEQVRCDGDSALRALTRRFDGAELAAFEVTEQEFADARGKVATPVLEALAEARQRLVTWHREGMSAPFMVETAPGVSCGRVIRGIGRVGLYVPAGTAPLPSTALMLGVPAVLADCGEIVLCTPPDAAGNADPTVLMAARLCGIDRIFKIGGAQAIAAMALGTDTVPRCDKLFGPGNAFVTECKRQVSSVSGGPAIDMPAGPSELLIIADGGASPGSVAADLLSQAEHGADSQVILASDSLPLLEAVALALEAQVATLPRAATARASLSHARLLLVDAIADAFVISNAYAPEHLILALREADAWLASVARAGSVFLGDHACETLGDYCSGTNHVLPTDGAARAYSGLSVASFQTSISVQSVSLAGLKAIGPCAVTLARAEGLEAHARAVLQRLEMQA